jgi:hypothetical protein
MSVAGLLAGKPDGLKTAPLNHRFANSLMQPKLKLLPMDTPLTAEPGSLDYASANLMQVFSGCLLVAIPIGAHPSNIPVPLAPEADSTGHKSRLATNSIAVLLGPRSNGLFAIRFADRNELALFLERNPASQQTLIMEHAEGAVVWHRTTTAFPQPLQLSSLSVTMTGNLLIYDRAALQCRDAFLNIGEIKAVELSALDWGPDPDGKIAAWLAVLTHGEFFRRGGRGQLAPNSQAWRAYLAARLKPTTAFDTRSRQFYHKAAGIGWQPLTDAQLRDELRRLVHVAPVGTAEARARLTDEWLSRLCARLKSSLATQLQIIEDRLRAYMQQRVIKEPGANMTNAELFADYEAHCNQAGQSSLSPMKFKMLIGQVLRAESWRAGYSKSIRRPAGQQNGWRGLRLRDQGESLMTTHGADGAPGVKS